MNHPLAEAVRNMLREAFDGPANPKETWFTNNEANSGIFGALKAVSAEEASTLVHETTLAAHTNHVRYHMSGTNELLKTGKYPEMDWHLSWAITSVNETQWEEVQTALQSEYLVLMQALEGIKWNKQVANEVCASLAHSVYHLGAMRQILKFIRTF